MTPISAKEEHKFLHWLAVSRPKPRDVIAYALLEAKITTSHTIADEVALRVLIRLHEAGHSLP